MTASTIWTCDRCPAGTSVPNGKHPWSLGVVLPITFTPRGMVGALTNGADLCWDCVRELRVWLETGPTTRKKAA